MSNGLLLWVDDEVELLRSHILFLSNKGYEVQTATNGADAIDMVAQTAYDLILLDEMMPGLSGLETLQRIKSISPATPVVMVTRSEEEHIMEQAIGAKIADYLIKPVKPSQILLSLKKNIHHSEIVNEMVQTGYRQHFQQIAMQMADCHTHNDWCRLYRTLVHWEMELDQTDNTLADLLRQQKEEANRGYAKYIKQHYMEWMEQRATARQRHQPMPGMPPMSPDIMKRKVFPWLDAGEQVFLVVIDNFRYDQWRAIEKDIARLFDIEDELYQTILPTATQYARNTIFSGLMPDEIARLYPQLWVNESEEGGAKISPKANSSARR